jgi:hypothetical protein
MVPACDRLHNDQTGGLVSGFAGFALMGAPRNDRGD